MKKKSISKLNTSLDKDSLRNEDLTKDLEPEITELADADGAEDDITYTMGDIKVLENDDDEKIELKVNASENEEDEEWVDPESIQDDYDPYLDGANYDMDNPYNDDEY